MAAPTETDVIIVGSGPTGLTMALELAVQNISFRIVDKAATRSDKSRALVVQPRTQELLSRYGNFEELIEAGNRGVGALVYANRKRVGRVDIADLGFTDTAFPVPLFVSQVETEDFLIERLKKYGKGVEYSISVEDIAQDEAGVSLTLNQEGEGAGSERVRAKYVVGADGAHSVVRHAAGLKFEGGTYGQDFILADVHLKWEQPNDHIMMFFGRGMMLLFPLKGHPDLVRLICMRPPDKETIDKEPDLDDFKAFFNHIGSTEGELYDPVWITRFRLHHRCAENYRVGRLFVAGDAAHIHSPAGGQGMNTGIQDAINLGWKLGQVLRGQKDDKFLDSYSVERHPIGRSLLKSTDRLFEWMTWSNPVFLYIRNLLVPWLVPLMANNRQRRAKAFQFFMQFGIHYRWSSIVRNAKGYQGRVQGGDRAPDGRIRKDSEGREWLLELCQGAKHQLLLFSGPPSDIAAGGGDNLAWQEDKFLKEGNLDGASVIKIYHSDTQLGSDGGGVLDVDGNLHVRYGFEKPGFIYVRPDGYVAYAGLLTSIEEFFAWTKQS